MTAAGFVPRFRLLRQRLAARAQHNSGGEEDAYLDKACGVKQASYRDLISVRAPDHPETAFFKLPADGRVAVFEILRVGFDESGAPFRLTVTVYPADRIVGYPSAALFQKPVDQIKLQAASLFREYPEAAKPTELPARARDPARYRAAQLARW